MPSRIPLRMVYRLGPRRHVQAGGFLVRVSEDARRCSVFLGWPDPDDDQQLSRIEGTGFLVGHSGFCHVVTAAHIAKILDGSPIGVRVSDSNGDARVIAADSVRWHFHSDQSVDVAVALFDPPDWSGVMVLPSDEFMDDRRIVEWEIGPGDAAYVVGLFYLHSGKKKNLPVVHAGHIALMPSDEKIPVADKAAPSGVLEVEAYLVEAQALPGASGSPVVVRPTVRFTAEHVPDGLSPHAPQPKLLESLAFAESRDFLLGVWIASWPGPPDNLMRTALGLPKDAWVPVGMGIVAPAQRIVEILRSTGLSDEREKMRKIWLKNRAATQTSAPHPKETPTAPEASNPHGKEDFMSLLTAAATKKPQAD
jgi:hypothetical protein